MLFALDDQFTAENQELEKFTDFTPIIVSEDNVHRPGPSNSDPDGLIMIHSFEVVFFPIAHIPILIFGASVQFSTPMFRTIILFPFFFNSRNGRSEETGETTGDSL